MRGLIDVLKANYGGDIRKDAIRGQQRGISEVKPGPLGYFTVTVGWFWMTGKRLTGL